LDFKQKEDKSKNIQRKILILAKELIELLIFQVALQH